MDESSENKTATADTCTASKVNLSLWFIMQQVTVCMKEAQPPNTATKTQNKCTNEKSQSVNIKQNHSRHCTLSC